MHLLISRGGQTGNLPLTKSRDSIIMWTQLPFGKHSGKILPQVLLTDPDWLYWAAVEKAIFWGPLQQEAADLAAKAARIKIPRRDPKSWAVEYIFDGEGRLPGGTSSRPTVGCTVARTTGND